MTADPSPADTPTVAVNAATLPNAPPTPERVYRDFLFAYSLFRKNSVPRDQFAALFEQWSRSNQRSFAEIAAHAGLVTPEVRTGIEQQLGAYIDHFGGASEAAFAELFRESFRSENRQRFLAFMKSATGELQESAGNSGSVRYVVDGIRGEGGLGRVWLVNDRELDRPVALKDLKPRFAEVESHRRRFLLEAKVTGRLQHPNIVPVYDLGIRPETGQPFYTMRFLKGKPLDALIDEVYAGKTGGIAMMDLHRLLRVFTGICNAIAYAHSQGVIHRDLKPANVLVGEFGEVMVLDWGLAKVLAATNDDGPESDSGNETDSQQTVAGTVIGTPAFMAPEQAAGRVDEVGPATDVYGLGAILFAILTGSPPHMKSEKETVRNLIDRVILAPTPRPSATRAGVAPPLDAICVKAMARVAANRYPAATALSADIESWLAGEAVSAYPEPWNRRVVRWMHRHRAATQFAFIALLAIVVGCAAAATYAWENANSVAALQSNGLVNEAENIAFSIERVTLHLADTMAVLRDSVLVDQVLLANLQQRNPAEAEQKLEPTLQRIFRSYLPIQSAAIVKAADGQEVYRVERNHTSGEATRPVDGWLGNHKDDKEFNAAIQLTPGKFLAEIEYVPRRRAPGRGDFCIVLAAPIYATGGAKPDGVVLAYLDMGRTLGVMQQDEVYCDQMYLVGGDGEILYYTHAPGDVHELPKIHETYPALAAFLASMERDKPTALVVPPGGDWMLAARRIPIADFPPSRSLNLILAASRTERAAESRRAAQRAFFLMVPAMLLTGLGLVVMSRLLKRTQS